MGSFALSMFDLELLFADCGKCEAQYLCLLVAVYRESCHIRYNHSRSPRMVDTKVKFEWGAQPINKKKSRVVMLICLW